MYLVVGILAIVIFIVISLIFLKLETKENFIEAEGEIMIKTVYLYAISFITLIMIIGGGVFAFSALADYISPATYHQTFHEYVNMKTLKYDKGKEVQISYSEEELRSQYDEMLKQQTQLQKNRALNSLIRSFGWILIPIPFFLLSRKNLKKLNR